MRRFEVLGEIGRGGFGRVLRVAEEGDDTAPHLALKLLTGAWRDDDEPVVRLRDEARLLARLRHPAIVRLYSMVQLDAGPGLLMELVDGPNLAVVLQIAGRLPVAAALEVVAAVAEALVYAWHLPGPAGAPLHLLHRDVKPHNVAVTRHGEVKLLDFGIAWADFQTREARSGPAPRGTATYMPPERSRGEDSPTVDVYGLGLLLANLLTGQPHPRLPEAIEEQPAFQSALGEQVLGALRPMQRAGEMITSLVLSCTEWAADARPTPQEVAELAAALAAEVGGTGLKAWAARKIPEVQARAASLADAAAVVGTVLSERSTGPDLRPTGLIRLPPELVTGSGAPPPPPPAEPVPPPLPPAGEGARRAGEGAPARIIGSRSTATVLAAALLLAVLSVSAWWAPHAPPPAQPAPSAPPPSAALTQATPTPPTALPTPPPTARTTRRASRRSPVTPAVTSVTPQDAHVAVTGDAQQVALLTPTGAIPLPADVPPGTYTVQVTFPDGERPFAYGQLTAAPGARYEVACLTAMLTCRTSERP